MIFVCGVHGVGKTWYCEKKGKEQNIKVFSASQLIECKKYQEYRNKRVNDIWTNQRILIEEVHILKDKGENFILDGHLCLINKKGLIEKIPMNVFRLLNFEKLIVLVDSPQLIKERINNRDNFSWNLEFIKKFQDEEVRYAKEIARELKCDLEIAISSEDDGCLRFSKNIILPIKPFFAEEILNGIKKYEYRKQLCMENIDKIYLYATSPVKKVVGEANILSKLVMNKEKLWSLTKNESGIEAEYFNEYFAKSYYASAYRLGSVKRYEKEISLEELQIFYYPQSYVYVGDII